MVEKFILWTLPGHICFYISHFIRVTLNCQDVYKPNMAVDGACVLIHIFISKINPFGLSDDYLPIVATNFTMIIYLVGSIVV